VAPDYRGLKCLLPLGFDQNGPDSIAGAGIEDV
jgi:hypothetical protein